MFRRHSFIVSDARPERAGAAAAVLAVAAVALAGCGRAADDHSTHASDGPTIRLIDVGAQAGSGEPQIVATDAGVVLSWLEASDDRTALRFAALADGAWSSARTVTSGTGLFANWADVPSVVPITSQIWAAHWLALVADSLGAYDVAAAVSRDAGKSFGAPVLLNDDGTETEHGFATLFPWDGDIGAVWLDGRQLAEWSFDEPDAFLGVSLRYARLAYSGEVLERGEIDDLVCDCCQTDVALAPTGPIVIYRDRTPEEVRDVAVRRFANGRWLDPVGIGAEGWHIEGCPVNGPAIAATGNDVVGVWFTAADGKARVRLARSTDGGESFAPALDVDAEGALGQADVELLDDATAVVSWWRRAPGGRTALALRTVGADGTLGAIMTVAEKATPQPLDVPEMARTRDGVVIAWTGSGDPGRVVTALVSGLR